MRVPAQMERSAMDKRFFGVLLLVAGILALVYGGFTYTRETHEAELGPLEIEVKDRERVNVPFWVGALLLAGGVTLLVVQPQRNP
jgi:hypothetical protein